MAMPGSPSRPGGNRVLAADPSDSFLGASEDDRSGGILVNNAGD